MGFRVRDRADGGEGQHLERCVAWRHLSGPVGFRTDEVLTVCVDVVCVEVLTVCVEVATVRVEVVCVEGCGDCVCCGSDCVCRGATVM